MLLTGHCSNLDAKDRFKSDRSIDLNVIDRSLQQNLDAKDRFKSDRPIDLNVIDRSLQQNLDAKDRFKSDRSIGQLTRGMCNEK